jgi:hypothetical protein
MAPFALPASCGQERGRGFRTAGRKLLCRTRLTVQRVPPVPVPRSLPQNFNWGGSRIFHTIIILDCNRKLLVLQLYCTQEFVQSRFSLMTNPEDVQGSKTQSKKEKSIFDGVGPRERL